MNETAKAWGDSPARTLNIGSHLPAYDKPVRKQSINTTESVRQDDALNVIQRSGHELGRDTDERKLYLDVVGERYGQVVFLAQTEELFLLAEHINSGEVNIDEQDDEIKDAIKSDFRALNSLNERLFGSVNPERFEAIVARARQKAATILEDPSTHEEDLRLSATRVLDTFPDARKELVDKHIHKPSQELLDAWRPAIEKKYNDLISLVDTSKEKYNATELCALFTEAINVMAEKWGLPRASEWKVDIGGTNVNVDLETKTIWVPAKRSCTAEKAMCLVVHEVGGHLLRNLLGEMSGDALLATDLPGRTQDEEALMVLIEQILTGKPREAGLPYYVAVGLASGTLSGNKVPLDELEQAVLDYTAVTKAKVLSETETETTKANVFRITRGMPSIVIDGELYQVPYNADLKYANGQENANDFMETNLGNPRAIDEAMLGKHAYSNPAQVEYVKSKTRNMPQTAVPSAT